MNAVFAAGPDWAVPQTLWSHWLGDPIAAVTLVAVAAAYTRGVRLLWARHGRGAVVRGWQAWAFGTGLATAAVAMLSPLDAAAHALLSVHMVQHLLLVLVVAPLLALGGPIAPMMAILSPKWRRGAHRLRGSAATRRLAHGAAGMMAACFAHVVAMWTWHLPLLYQAAVNSTLVHGLEHAMMAGTAMWMWATMIQQGGPLRRVRPTGAVAMFLTGTLTVGLAPLMTLSQSPWYGVYAERAAAWGLTPLADQQIAGGIMWGVGGLFYPVAGAVMLALWLRRDARVSPANRGAASAPWWHDEPAGFAPATGDPERTT